MGPMKPHAILKEIDMAVKKNASEPIMGEAVTEVTAEGNAPAVKDDGYVDHAPLFKDGEKYKFPLNVTVNGVKYSVPRGVPLRIPRIVAEIIDQSIAQDSHARELDARMQKTQVTEF
jgi:hypothetical protein